MKQKRIIDKDCCYKSFKFKQNHHSVLVNRRNLLGQSIEWQVDEAVKEFTENHDHELTGKERKEIIYKFRTFKFRKKFHQILLLRRDLLGQIIEWQLNKAVEEYLDKHSKELEIKEKEKEITEAKEKEKAPEAKFEIVVPKEEITEVKEEVKEIKEETKEKDENPKQEIETKSEATL